jgi:hypothetical protein
MEERSVTFGFARRLVRARTSVTITCDLPGLPVITAQMRLYSPQKTISLPEGIKVLLNSLRLCI